MFANKLFANKRIGLSAAALHILFLSALFPAAGQGMQYVLHSETRVFPSVGPGVAAIKRDAIGHYYVLAGPASSILIFDAAARPIGKIPNANSRGTTIRYAVSIDLDSHGRLYVADRGDNAVKIFAPDGALVANVAVTAPTSVVALSDGQFAVTKLQSKRLVQIMDQSGATVRTFGDPGDMGASTPTQSTAGFTGAVSSAQQPPAPLVDRGRIIGDSSGNIYFAFTSLADPTLQRFDRYGYSAYDSVMSSTDFGALGGHNGRDIELGVTMSGGLSPESVSAWTDLHSVGASLGPARGHRGRGGAGGGMGGPGGSGGGAMGGSGGGMGAPGNNTTGPGGSSNGFADGGAGSDTSSDDDFTAALAGDSSDLTGLLAYNGQSSSSNYDSSLFATSTMGAFGAGMMPGMMPGMLGMGLGGRFHFGDFHGGGGPGGMGPGEPGGMGGGEGSHPDFAGGKPGGFEDFHFHPGFSTLRTTATVRVALDDPSKHKLEKPVITAVGVDPQTQEAWVAIGDMLAHLDNNGNRLDTYYVTITGEATVKASAILVEPDRILIASESWGIYEFPRPDKPSQSPPSAPPASTAAAH